MNDELTLADDFSLPTFEEWKAEAGKALKGAPYAKKLVTGTYEGIDLQPIYTAADSDSLPHTGHKPGSGSFVRGTHCGGYLEQPWEICQEITASSARQFNEALKHDLQHGQTGITLFLDRHRGGFGIDSREDLAAALAGIDLETYPLHIIPGHSALEPLQLLAAYLDGAGLNKNLVKGSIDTDPLGVLAVHGNLPTDISTVYDNMAEAIRWAKSHMPGMKTIGPCGLPYHNAGADAVRELAYVIAGAVHYIDQMQERGLPVDTIAGSMRFTFAVGPFFFMEIAKLRAARMLWSKIIVAYGGSNKSAGMTIHGKTSRYNQTICDPYVNMLRTTTEAFAAITSGVDSLSTNRFNETFAPADEFSRRVARNTQNVLLEECKADRLIDPAGGSYFVESLTLQVAEKAWKHFQQIETKGGMLEALLEGFPQHEIKGVAGQRQEDIAGRKSILVGTNFSANVKEALPLPDSPGDIHPGGTAGEVTVEPLDFHRAAERFEKLRQTVQAYKEKTGCKTGPKVFLAVMGPLSQHKARADFALSFFETGGFDVIYPHGHGFDSGEAAVEAASASGAGVVVICSTDETYPDLVPPIVSGLKKKNADVITVLAGYPKDRVEEYKKAGVDEFIYIGADACGVLTGILNKPGVRS
jgi:methylmalonyl-CoA mutase